MARVLVVDDSMYHCTVLDLLMPKVGGVQVLRELHDKHLTVPVIVHIRGKEYGNAAIT